MPEERPKQLRRLLINAFILFHLYIILVWGLPGSTFRYFLTRPITSYVIETGLWHSWDMFSPDPLSINFNVEAIIRYQNGAEKVWNFPRMDKLGIWTRYQKERYRKWTERARLDAYAVAWEDAARWAARQNDTPANHPVHVTLVRRWAPIPVPVSEPGKRNFARYQPMIAPDPNFLFNYHYGFYDIKPADL